MVLLLHPIDNPIQIHNVCVRFDIHVRFLNITVLLNQPIAFGFDYLSQYPMREHDLHVFGQLLLLDL